jgi:hypothetical protein
MAFPKLECHFSSIDRTPSRTTVKVLVYTCADGGLDVDGHQILIRTLRRTLNLKLDAGLDNPRVLSHFLERLATINADLSLNIQLADRICTL